MEFRKITGSDFPLMISNIENDFSSYEEIQRKYNNSKIKFLFIGWYPNEVNVTSNWINFCNIKDKF